MKTLTVVVVDKQGKPDAGAEVSIMPSGESGVTNSAGEIKFEIGNALKYDITARSGGKTVTVPYYVTETGATRLVVNPVYVQAREQELNPSARYETVLPSIGIGLAILLILIILWKIFFRYKRRR